MDKYRYKTIKNYFGGLNEGELNELGSEGWNLINILSYPDKRFNSGVVIKYYFKQKYN